jgi:hypothetical protein
METKQASLATLQKSITNIDADLQEVKDLLIAYYLREAQVVRKE